MKNQRCECGCGKSAPVLHQRDDGKFVVIGCLNWADVKQYPRLSAEWQAAKGKR